MDIFNEENNTASDIEFYLITLDIVMRNTVIPKILSYFEGRNFFTRTSIFNVRRLEECRWFPARL
jgi:hypothetical protein